ncbi:Aldehyde/histidinol dehydrogenase [Limtongia smithiae]|uniref:Aldehyde/histidinol dehydrogenase n=1 Tax=Limtongia smithiae TaxID=1125753 RepID=UPI0034CD444A
MDAPTLPPLALTAAAVTVLAATAWWWVFHRAAASAGPIPSVAYSFPPESSPSWTPPSSDTAPTPIDAIHPGGVEDPLDPHAIRAFCPATGAQLSGAFRASTRSDIDAAVTACGVAQKEWARTTFAERRRVLSTLLEYLKAHQDEVVRVACRDSGKTLVDAALGEVMVTLEKIAWTLAHGEAALRPSRRAGPASLLLRYKTAEVVYEPLGVVLALVSWNYPLHNLLNPAVAALFSGNGIVLKCSESVVWSSTHFVAITRACVAECGYNPDIVQLVCPWPHDTDYLTSHRGISHATFIGSKPVAHKVLAAAARTLTPVTVELGGKDAAVVLDEYASDWSPSATGKPAALASVLMRACFQSAGQNCIGIERIIAEPKAYDYLLSVLPSRVAALRLGSALDDVSSPETTIDMGAMINDTRFAEIEALIADAVAHHGARLLHGGARLAHPTHPRGAYFAPTLLVDVPPTAPLARAELFAPVMVLMRAANVDEAITLSNAPGFGLGGAVFGASSRSAAVRAVVRGMRAGNVAVNDFATFYVCQLPFGGVDDSGYGKFGGEEGLRALCLVKSICTDRYPGVRTVIPPVVDYPLRDGDRAWRFVRALNVASYAGSVSEFVTGIAQLLRNM